MLVSLAATLCLASMLLAAYGLGQWLLNGLIPTPAPRGAIPERLDDIVWSLALGLVGAGLLLMGLGFAGLLYAPLIMALTAAGCLMTLRRIMSPEDALLDGGDWTTPSSLVEGKIEAESLDPPRRTRHANRDMESDDSPRTRLLRPARWLRELLLIVACLAAGGAYVSALAPPTDGDALCYHLELPKVFLSEHRIVYLPDSSNSTYPMLAELWFLWGLALQGPVAAQLVHWSLGVLLALAAVVLARPLVGNGWAMACGCLVLLVPGVTNQMTAPLNDVAVTTFTTLTLAAWWKSAVQDEPGHWPVVAGLMLGAALSIKFTAILFAAGMGVAWAVIALRSANRNMLLRQAAIVGLVAISTAGGWYLRSAWHTGDPVFPMLSRSNSPENAANPAIKRPFSWHPADLALAPLRLTLEPERFGGRSHQFGAMFLAVLPGLLFVRKLRGLGVLLAISAIYALLWYGLRQNVRFLYPIAPLLIVPVVWVWAEFARLPRLPRVAATVVLLMIATSGAVISVARTRGHWAVACGWQSREDYLARSEPSYEPAQAVNALLPPEARIFSQEQRAFYFERTLIRERRYRERTAYHQAPGATGWLDEIREDGFTHLLLAATVPDEGPATPDVLERLVAAQEASYSPPPWRELAHWRFEQPGTSRRYRLLELTPSGHLVADQAAEKGTQPTPR